MWQLLLIGLLSLTVAGCDKLEDYLAKRKAATQPPLIPITMVSRLQPCQLPSRENGFIHVEVTVEGGKTMMIRPLSHCIPCNAAKLSAEKFVCEGGTQE